ncbi:hypothetical protein HII31_00287 [Pseudocercospora fuligena]|uniref:BTB domain-containing protein n=1 Tax=Pseudocercospora fuligena TaxID=685502 RepID=A0A8H6RXA7_9PEZI|nr:hypothetical protein HII31_00287 [Pseudocercospora fuligena]
MALENARNVFLTNFAALRDREDLSDVTIHCGSYFHQAHHFVCRLHSPVLDRLCLDAIAEPQAKAEAKARARVEAEAKGKAGTNAEEDSEADTAGPSPPEFELDVDLYGEGSVERLISFLYTCDYEEKFDYEEWEIPELRLCVHAQLSFIAHDMAIDALKALAIERFEGYLQRPVTIDGLKGISQVVSDPRFFAGTKKIRELLVNAVAKESQPFLQNIDLDELQDIIDIYPALSQTIAAKQHQLRQSQFQPASIPISTTSKNYYPRPVHPSFPIVIKINDKWQTICCAICDANAEKGVFFDGVAGVRAHVQKMHGGVALMSDQEKWLQMHPPLASEVSRMHTGRETVRPFNGLPKSEWKRVALKRTGTDRSRSV